MKRRRIKLIIGALLLLGCALFYFTRSSEPIYAGRPLTQWLKLSSHRSNAGSALPDPDIPWGDENRALRAIGTNGIPILLELLQAKDPPGVTPLENLVQRLGWKTFHISSAEEKRRLATHGFYMLGTNVNSAAPALLKLLQTNPPESKARIVTCLR